MKARKMWSVFCDGAMTGHAFVSRGVAEAESINRGALNGKSTVVRVVVYR